MDGSCCWGMWCCGEVQRASGAQESQVTPYPVPQGTSREAARAGWAGDTHAAVSEAVKLGGCRPHGGGGGGTKGGEGLPGVGASDSTDLVAFVEGLLTAGAWRCSVSCGRRGGGLRCSLSNCSPLQLLLLWRPTPCKRWQRLLIQFSPIPWSLRVPSTTSDAGIVTQGQGSASPGTTSGATRGVCPATEASPPALLLWSEPRRLGGPGQNQ